MSFKTGVVVAWRRWTLDRDSLPDAEYVELVREEQTHRRSMVGSARLWCVIVVIGFTLVVFSDAFTSFLDAGTTLFGGSVMAVGTILFVGFAAGVITGGLVAGLLSWLGESSDQRRMAELLVTYYDRCSDGGRAADDRVADSQNAGSAEPQ